MKNLAIRGGERVIDKQLPKYNSIGEEEKQAAIEVIESGVLSDYLGSWSENFGGGPKVRLFEENIKSYFNVEHAVTVNSWTSGLAAGAIELEPGDEVIVTWTMSATATAILHWNAILFLLILILTHSI